MDIDEKFEKRRKHEGFIHERIEKDILFKRMPLKKQKEYKDKVRISNIDYTFLQYSYMIRTWATRNYKISPRHLDALLYLYPISIFTTSQFNKSMKELGMNDYTILKKLRDGGWISLWSKSGNKKYHVLSHKANELIKKMHKMFILEEEVPMSARRNVIVRSRKKTDQQLVDLFKIFNDKVKENN